MRSEPWLDFPFGMPCFYPRPIICLHLARIPPRPDIRLCPVLRYLYSGDALYICSAADGTIRNASCPPPPALRRPFRATAPASAPLQLLSCSSSRGADVDPLPPTR